MVLFENIRLKIGNYILSRKKSRDRRKISYTNISQIKNIGIVWDASRSQEFPSLSGFILKMKERGINVKIIGYYPGKILPDMYTAIRYLSCIRENELNYFFIPVTPDADQFIHNRFDILIDINFKKVFPLYFISSLSEACFKVGLSDNKPEQSPFDLMIDCKNSVNIDDYLYQVLHYLEMINSGPDIIVNR